jgi:L-lactate utilization protein LutB
MRPLETIPRISGVEKRRAVDWVSSSMIYLIYCKDFCKCHNVPPLSITIKKIILKIKQIKLKKKKALVTARDQT